MSKIAELLKLAEKKKEDQKIAVSSSPIVNLDDSVSKGKQEDVIASKSNEEQVRVSKSK